MACISGSCYSVPVLVMSRLRHHAGFVVRRASPVILTMALPPVFRRLWSLPLGMQKYQVGEEFGVGVESRYVSFDGRVPINCWSFLAPIISSTLHSGSWPLRWAATSTNYAVAVERCIELRSATNMRLSSCRRVLHRFAVAAA